MSTQAQDKEAARVARWIEGLSAGILSMPVSQTLLSTHDLALVFKELATDIRAGEHRKRPRP